MIHLKEFIVYPKIVIIICLPLLLVTGCVPKINKAVTLTETAVTSDLQKSIDLFDDKDAHLVREWWRGYNDPQLDKIIDEVRFHHALHEAQAIAQTRKAEYEMKKRQYARRNAADDEIVSAENREDALYNAQIAHARYEEAMTQVETEELNCERSSVRAPTDGWVSNLLLRKGDFVQAGEKRMAIITSGSFWVYGYFEEHKLSLIHIGDQAQMKMLGTKYTVKGHVESIARGIADRDNVTDGRLLANVNPIFTWVRLAQRIPVRIHIDEVPKGMALSAGMTCSVSIAKSDKRNPLIK